MTNRAPSKADHLAVLFADVAESTALYRHLGDIEALRIVTVCLNALKAVLPKHQGRLVKTLGDAVMCLFPDAECAVAAAIDMQRATAKLRPRGKSLQIRIGLHIGAVVVGGDDVYGDTVNVAAYLAYAATPEQILIAGDTLHELSPTWRDAVRPIFDAILKGALATTTVFEVLWRDDAPERTEINLHTARMIPQDIGSLLLDMGEKEWRVDHWRPIITIGRGTDSDITLNHGHTSRHHATIRIERTQFYLADHSINGTFVLREGGEEMHVVRREVALEGTGQIRLGYSKSDTSAPYIGFWRDRRSMYRV